MLRASLLALFALLLSPMIMITNLVVRWTEPGLMQVIDYQNKGIPIGRAAEVNLRNNHAQYIFTW